MEWISVKDRLPEVVGNRIPSSVGCLVVAKAGKPTVMYMEYEKAIVRKKVVYRWIWMNSISSWEVTHWMPLPEPPKE